MTSFNIQIRNPETGKWEGQQTIKPAYKYSRLRFRRWLFFWRTYGIVLNIVEADKLAFKLAVRLAKKMHYKLPCRVERVTWWGGSEAKDIVWQNGKQLMKPA